MVDLIERILRMPRVVMTVMVLLLLAGGFTYSRMPKESFPAVDIPYFYVSVGQKGISPKDAERLLAKPIEDRLMGLDGLEHITSTSVTGHASVFLEFNVNTDKDKALEDIRAELDGVSSELPADADEPGVFEISFTDQPIISVALYGDVPERILIEKAKELQDVLEDLDGANEAKLSGAREEVLEIQIDLLHLEAYNITAAQLFDALAKNNTMVAGGTLDSGQGAFNVEVPGLISTAEQVFNLPLKVDGDTVVTFGDVAHITKAFKDATEYSYVNGSPAITIGVTKAIGANIIELSKAVRETTEAVTADWPGGIEYSFLLDQAISTENLYRSLEAAVMTAVVLVLIMCIATLGLRPALLIGLSIPLSFMMGFLVLDAMDMTVNMMVMFGLVIAVGVLVDDPIVVVEYAERKLMEGVSKKEAFILSARKMFVPVVGATATTLGAFIPLLFWPGIIGKFMSYLPIVVIAVMVASLVSALIFMPVVGAFIAKHEHDEKRLAAANTVMYADQFDTKKVRGITGVYVRIMARLLRHPILTLTAGFSIIVGIFMAYAANPTGMEAFPETEPEFATVSVVTRGNYSPIELRDLMLEVESEVLSVVGIQDSIMNFGGSDGSPPDTIGHLQLQLQPWSERRTADEIFAELRERVSDISGLEIQISQQESGPPAGKAINLRVESVNYDNLIPAVTKLRDFIEFELGDTIEIEDGRPAPGIDWNITVDRTEAAKYGLGIRELTPYIQLVTTGVNLGTYKPSDSKDELDIVVRLPKEERTFEALDSLRIVTQQGLIPVSNFIEREAVLKTGSITRTDGLYSMTVAANLEPGVRTDEKVAELQDWADEQTWPTGLEIIYGGAEEQTNETNEFMAKAGAGAIFIIFIVLLLEYNSFYQVAVTLSTVVMSTAGVLLGMLITGQAFSAVMTGLGIVALTGIVVKNGIVLIDTYNHYTRDEDVDPITSMLLTTAQRIRPVLLTATVTALGVIPMALNVEFDFIRREIVKDGLAGEFFVNLASALVSGLLFSTLLTLVMVPVMITAPAVIGGRLKVIGRWIGARLRKNKPDTAKSIEIIIDDEDELVMPDLTKIKPAAE